jgi:hypothetical protein
MTLNVRRLCLAGYFFLVMMSFMDGLGFRFLFTCRHLHFLIAYDKDVG